MASYTYPVARTSGGLTPAETHLILQDPELIAARVADLADQRFIGDFLLASRFEARGGGIFYENGEEIFPADASASVGPNGEYPKTVLTSGEITAAKTDKRGLETDITDERIARFGQGTLDRALTKLANGVIRDVDRVAMAVVASKITDTFASQAWTSIANVIAALTAAKANREDLALGLDLDTVALSGDQWAKVMALFAAAGVLPREDGNPIVSGQFPTNLLGYTWVTSPNIVGSDPLLVDREQLGGMADEDLQSPDYVRSGAFNVETYTNRNKTDSYTVRARRVVVPVVIEPHAGLRITGTTL
ncbi:phage major capsid protein [Microbacterium sp. 2RAF4]|uniref:phage major capsid protein n=1 Tax=Microbacterium sp. 2RAF4 TaxID=3232999 RepID=UPI003F94AFA5